MELVTGASGFVGSHLMRRMPNASTAPHENLYYVPVRDYNSIYFLSTYGNMASHTDENQIIKANVYDLIYVLSGLDMATLNSFVYISTSSVKLKHQTFYSRTKRMAEEVLLAYMEKYNVPITIIRPFSITGVGEQPEHLIPRLIDSCLNGTQMPFVEDATHDYIDVEDVVDGILTLAGKRAKGIFELGTGTSHSNSQVLAMVEKATGKKANVKRVKNMRAYDTKNWESTNFRVRQYGWEPKKTLADSIKEAVNEAQGRQVRTK